MKVKVAIFYDQSMLVLKQQVNSFLEAFNPENVIDIKFSATNNNFNVVVIYKSF